MKWQYSAGMEVIMKDITHCHPKLQKLADKLLSDCSEQGIKIAIGECLRTVAEQDERYAQGRTKPGSIITNAKGSTYSSMHQWGVAFDFYRDDGKGAYDESGNFFVKAGKIGKAIGLEWGGDWNSIIDKPHFQLPDWGSDAGRLKERYGTPDKFIKTWVPVKPAKPSKTVTSKSPKNEVLWLQQQANLVIARISLKNEKGGKILKLKEDGVYDTKSKAFVRAYWKLLGWKNSDTAGNAGIKTIAALDIWRE